MANLMAAGRYRLSKCREAFIVLILILIVGMLMGAQVAGEMEYRHVTFGDGVLHMWALVIGAAAAILCVTLDGTEIADGTLRNKIICGKSRAAVYYAGLVTDLIAVFTACGVFFLGVWIVEAAHGIGAPADWAQFAVLVGVTLVDAVAWTCLYHLIGISLARRSAVTIVCFLLFLVLLAVAAYLGSVLDQPEMITYYQTEGEVMWGDAITAEAMGGDVVQAPNPEYVGGPARGVYEFWLNVLPGGAAIRLYTLPVVSPWLMVYGAAFSAVCIIAGHIIFRRRNLQ